jgi:hypothetical protein
MNLVERCIEEESRMTIDMKVATDYYCHLHGRLLQAADAREGGEKALILKSMSDIGLQMVQLWEVAERYLENISPNPSVNSHSTSSLLQNAGIDSIYSDTDSDDSDIEIS